MSLSQRVYLWATEADLRQVLRDVFAAGDFQMIRDHWSQCREDMLPRRAAEEIDLSGMEVPLGASTHNLLPSDARPELHVTNLVDQTRYGWDFDRDDERVFLVAGRAHRDWHQLTQSEFNLPCSTPWTRRMLSVIRKSVQTRGRKAGIAFVLPEALELARAGWALPAFFIRSHDLSGVYHIRLGPNDEFINPNGQV